MQWCNSKILSLPHSRITKKLQYGSIIHVPVDWFVDFTCLSHNAVRGYSGPGLQTRGVQMRLPRWLLFPEHRSCFEPEILQRLDVGDDFPGPRDANRKRSGRDPEGFWMLALCGGVWLMRGWLAVSLHALPKWFPIRWFYIIFQNKMVYKCFNLALSAWWCSRCLTHPFYLLS